jgi:nicotinate (nicotinamide) nucleotide adenylyltransferase
VEFIQRAHGTPARLGILPGTFNPPTVAHLALGHAALSHVDEVLFALPRALPHKEFHGATFDQRLAMLRAALAGESRFSIGATDRGLFAEIADECRAVYGDSVRLSFLCGRDAAERIAGWDYGRPEAFAEMLRSFDLLVAQRAGSYDPPSEIAPSIRPLTLDGEFDHISASEIRDRIARGEPWEHLVPQAIHSQVRRIYLPEGGL